MMDWEKVLKFEDIVVEIASKLSYRIDPSLREDVIQHTFIALHDKVDLSKALGDEREYVKGAVWNIVQRFFRDEKRHNHVRVDELTGKGVQILEDSTLVWGGQSEGYSGDYTEDNGQEKE